MSNKKLLVIAASNGENLKLAKRFLVAGKELHYSCELLDLTESKNDLPIFNPRHNSNDKAPKNLKSINTEMESHSHWVICAPEYNGSIPPILTNAIAWLSVEGTDFRSLFNERPIAIASFSGGGCMELLLSMRIQLTHLGALVIGRQLATNKSKVAEDKSINAILNQLLQLNYSN
jgi:NAD(P)H-dependent FMN reductase